MNVAIAGGTGFVGRHLTEALVKNGHKIYILTRSPQRYTSTETVIYIGWLHESFHPQEELPPLDAIINLAGDTLFGYWSKTKKQRILNSRIQATQNILDLIKLMNKKPEVLINASAIGYYGTSTQQSYTEDTLEHGNDFLAHVTHEWEKTAKKAEEFGVRTVLTRFGVILGKEGALPLMSLPFKLLIGGKTGSGEQWISWIHIKDVVGLIIFALGNQNVRGPLNVTAPSPMRNKEFNKILSKELSRPYWLPAPSFALRSILGEMSTLILDGQSVLPQKALKNHYTYYYSKLDIAFSEIF